jgi:hypothetical protein
VALWSTVFGLHPILLGTNSGRLGCQ